MEFAACDQSGNGLLLEGWLLQFGKKHVEPGKVKDLQILLEDTKTLAITAFRDEWQEKQAISNLERACQRTCKIGHRDICSRHSRDLRGVGPFVEEEQQAHSGFFIQTLD